jgi:Fe-S-cluster containining protein
MADFEHFWTGVGGFLTSSTRCETCDLCERDNIYILPEELDLIRARHEGEFDVVRVSGADFIRKTTPYCPYYDQAAHRCGIYDHRPFACRIYPLDVILHRDRYGVEGLWWVVHDTCPITRDYADAGKLDWFRIQAEKLEQDLDPDIAKSFRRQDLAARGLEYLFRTPLKYTPLKPFEPAQETAGR